MYEKYMLRREYIVFVLLLNNKITLKTAKLVDLIIGLLTQIFT
jgi:hypothetical protein